MCRSRIRLSRNGPIPALIWPVSSAQPIGFQRSTRSQNDSTQSADDVWARHRSKTYMRHSGSIPTTMWTLKSPPFAVTAWSDAPRHAAMTLDRLSCKPSNQPFPDRRCRPERLPRGADWTGRACYRTAGCWAAGDCFDLFIRSTMASQAETASCDCVGLIKSPSRCS
jgi:hypothetical protein